MAYIILDNIAGGILRLSLRPCHGVVLQEFRIGHEPVEIALSQAQCDALLRALPREALWDALRDDIERPDTSGISGLSFPPIHWFTGEDIACGMSTALVTTTAPGRITCPTCKGIFRHREAAMLHQARLQTDMEPPWNV